MREWRKCRKNNCKRKIRPLIREGAPYQKMCNSLAVIKKPVLGFRWGLRPRQTCRLSVGRNINLNLTCKIRWDSEPRITMMARAISNSPANRSSRRHELPVNCEKDKGRQRREQKRHCWIRYQATNSEEKLRITCNYSYKCSISPTANS
jgi:hypothetical protein